MPPGSVRVMPYFHPNHLLYEPLVYVMLPAHAGACRAG